MSRGCGSSPTSGNGGSRSRQSASSPTPGRRAATSARCSGVERALGDPVAAHGATTRAELAEYFPTLADDPTLLSRVERLGAAVPVGDDAFDVDAGFLGIGTTMHALGVPLGVMIDEFEAVEAFAARRGRSATSSCSSGTCGSRRSPRATPTCEQLAAAIGSAAGSGRGRGRRCAAQGDRRRRGGCGRPPRRGACRRLRSATGRRRLG